jgi:hypothetical protein
VIVITALEARRVRLRVGKPLAEVDRLYRLESFHGQQPYRLVPWYRVGEAVDYGELLRREALAARSEQAEALARGVRGRS